jgi:hypothetical protein
MLYGEATVVYFGNHKKKLMYYVGKSTKFIDAKANGIYRHHSGVKVNIKICYNLCSLNIMSLIDRRMHFV